jgi:hypothetical protein
MAEEGEREKRERERERERERCMGMSDKEEEWRRNTHTHTHTHTHTYTHTHTPLHFSIALLLPALSETGDEFVLWFLSASQWKSTPSILQPTELWKDPPKN